MQARDERIAGARLLQGHQTTNGFAHDVEQVEESRVRRDLGGGRRCEIDRRELSTIQRRRFRDLTGTSLARLQCVGHGISNFSSYNIKALAECNRMVYLKFLGNNP